MVSGLVNFTFSSPFVLAAANLGGTWLTKMKQKSSARGKRSGFHVPTI
jgi:hypothetical protein